MNGRTARSWLVAAVAVPIIGVLALIARAEWAERSGTAWVIPIAGYDPRDLLHGHYLQYRYELPWQGTNTCSQTQKAPWGGSPARPLGQRAQQDPTPGCCLCLTRTRTDPRPSVREVSCAHTDTCDGWFRSDALMPPKRYFVPEERARELETALQNRSAAIRLRSTANGHAVVGELLLDGQPWREALAE